VARKSVVKVAKQDIARRPKCFSSSCSSLSPDRLVQNCDSFTMVFTLNSIFTLSSAPTHHFFTTVWLEWNHFPQDVEQNKHRKTPRCKCHRTSFEASSSDRIRASEVNRNKGMTVILQHYKQFYITLGIPFLAGLRIFLQQQQYKSKTLAGQ